MLLPNNKREYITMIGKLNDGFADNGWADGYADFDSDEERIIKQLYKRIPLKKLYQYVNEYLKGYEIGKEMSERAFEIYDEDGCIKDNCNFDSIFDYYDEISKKISEMQKNGELNSSQGISYVISLDEYKEKLVNSYKYEIDNTDKKREERRKRLSKIYSDEFLNKIINDTYNIINKICDMEDVTYCMFELPEDSTTYISLDLSGGYFSDRLYIDVNGNIISESILKMVFGRKLMVQINCEEEEFEDEFNGLVMIGINRKYSLYLQDFPSNMKELKENLFGKTKINKIDE